MSDNKEVIERSADDKNQRSLDHSTTTTTTTTTTYINETRRNRDEDSNDDHLEKNSNHHSSGVHDRNQGDGINLENEELRDHGSKSRKVRHQSRHRSDSKHRDKKKSSKKRRRNSSSSESSSSSDEYSSDSDSDDNRRRRRHDKEKKKKYESKKHKRDEDRSKDRKSKKKKHKKERTSSEQSTSATPTFGQYGIIKSSDMSKMQRSFEVWLSEVHGVHISSSNIPRYELQQYFDTYREDYNTATLPHIKYYNYDKWELEEHEKQKREFELSGKNSSAIINDERNHAMEMQRIAKQKEEAALHLIAATMNTTKVKEMQHQKQLQTQMQMAFKMGDHETYRKIKEKLQPPEK